VQFRAHSRGPSGKDFPQFRIGKGKARSRVSKRRYRADSETDGGIARRVGARDRV